MRKILSTRRTWTRGVAVSALMLGMATTAPEHAVAQEARVAAEQHAVSQKNLQFNPYEMSVTVGDTVTWTNHETDGQTIHSVVQTGGTEINSPDIPPETSFSWTFTQVQDYNFHCRFHPDMFMTLHVLNAPAAGKTAKGDKAAKGDKKTTKDTKSTGKGAKKPKKAQTQAPAMDHDAMEASAAKSKPAPAPGPPESTIPGIAGLPFAWDREVRPTLGQGGVSS
jgi:plastocyanin